VFPSAEAPNHVLINRYVGGEGILGHTDGPLYHPRTATLSLSLNADEDDSAGEGRTEKAGNRSHAPRFGAILTFQRRQPTCEVGTVPPPPVACEVALLGRSLVVFAGAAYTNHLHAIAEKSIGRTALSANATSAVAPLCTGAFDVVGATAPLANGAAAGLVQGDVLWRPAVRISLTFRHIRLLDDE
jgi:hypothetical protein